MIFGLFAGVLADALPKRQTLIGDPGRSRCASSIILAILADHRPRSLDPAPDRAGARASARVNAVDMPVRQSFAVEMVGREDIGNAVALNSAMFNGARIIGPAVAGLVIGAVGVAAAFVIDAVSFLAVIVGLLAMREHRAASRRPGSPDPSRSRGVMTQLREGLHYVRTTPVVLIAVLVVGLVSTFGMNFSVIIPPYADDDPRQRRRRATAS